MAIFNGGIAIGAIFFSLTSDKSYVLENEQFTITFNTNLGGLFAYTITGVSSSDINNAPLTGFVKDNDSITFTNKTVAKIL